MLRACVFLWKPFRVRAVSTQIGFIGLGTMGGPMAMNVLSKHPNLLVYDAGPSARVQKLRDAGARVASCISEFKCCAKVVLCLPDGDVVESVVLRGSHSEPPLYQVLGAALIIDCSTTHPSTARRIACSIGTPFIDAPVTGEPKRAEDGTLTIMVGGLEQHYLEALPVLESMAANVVHMGPHGTGQLAKALNNSLYNVSCAAMGEVLALATKAGLNTGALCRVVSSGTGQSFGFNKFSALVGERKFAAPQFGYPMASAFKDMQVVAEVADAHEARSDLRVLAATTSTYEKALEMGLGREHKGAMTKVYEDKLGVTVTH